MAEEIVKTDEGLAPDAFDLAFEAAAGVDAVEEAAVEEKVVEKEAAVDEKVEPTVEEKAAADKAAAEKAEVDRKAAADKAAADKAAADKAAADKAAADKAAAEKAEADRLAQEQFTEEEQAAIDANAKDFPDVHKAYEARERVLVTKLTNKFMAELAAVRNELGQQIAPVASRIANNDFEAAVLKVHPDAFDIVDKVDAWVATKPAFMQAVFNNILDTAAGGPQATNELLDLFKAETGSAQSSGQSAEEKAAAEAKAAEEKAAKDKKLQSQEGVRSRSTQKQAAVDPDDYDGAFDKFAATA